MAQVEDQVIAQLDRLVEELLSRDHGPGGDIPRRPQLAPIVQ